MTRSAESGSINMDTERPAKVSTLLISLFEARARLTWRAEAQDRTRYRHPSTPHPRHSKRCARSRLQHARAPRGHNLMPPSERHPYCSAKTVPSVERRCRLFAYCQSQARYSLSGCDSNQTHPVHQCANVSDGRRLGRDGLPNVLMRSRAEPKFLQQDASRRAHEMGRRLPRCACTRRL